MPGRNIIRCNNWWTATTNAITGRDYGPRAGDMSIWPTPDSPSRRSLEEAAANLEEDAIEHGPHS